MDFAPNMSSHNDLGVGNEGNKCGIDFSQDAIFLPVLYGIFFIVGVPLNVIALYGLYNLIKSENVLPVYVINLLISDLLQLLTLPLWMDYYSNGHNWRFGPRTCQVMALIFYICIYASIFFMCIIALERHLAIAQPLKFQAMRRLKYARWVALGLWAVIAVPPSVAFDTLFPAKENYTLCIEKYPSGGGFIIYRLVTLVLSFVLPFSFIIALHRKTLQSLAGVGSLVQNEKRRIRSLLTLLVVIFVLVMGPYHFIGCVKYVGLLLHPQICQWERDVFVAYQLGRGLLSLNSILDPVLYMFLRTDFRGSAFRYIPCLKTVEWSLSQQNPSRGISGERPTNSTQDSE
ncbi:G-protein coupled receptor 4 [Megalops cyprinoides]|uniref:G-protein coupled receptor 4 n=1 Tax=Megalops cyprinoides TaxID=118141 RepID=UPI0018644500|nr:G-protein coupled receptor 4 [Megalops cyprinoides]